MPMPPDEPKSPEQVQQWIEKHAREHDRFAHVAAKYAGHRATHGCYDVYPYPNGSVLGTLAATHRAQRILEVGCGIGYSALWFAYGGGPGNVHSFPTRSSPDDRAATDEMLPVGLP